MTSQVHVNASAAPEAPRIDGDGLVRNLLRFRADKMRFMMEAARTAPVVQFRLATELLYLIREPEHVKHVLVDNNHNYDKQTIGYNALRRFLGEGLLTSEGDFWRRQRRIAQPAFHRKRVAGFADTMVSMTEDMLTRWEDLALADRATDMAEEMSKLTLRIAGMTLLGTDPAADADEIGASVTILNHYVNWALMQVVPIPEWVPIHRNREGKRAAATIDRVVNGIIKERRASGEDPGDLLSMLMLAEDEDTGERMNDVQLRDEVVTMFLAGHETTANTLAWTFYLLSLHPEAGRGIREEVREVLGDRPATAADARSLAYTERVIKEAMRLFPPAWMIDRNPIEDDVIGGVRIRKGSLLAVSPYITHRLPSLWPNPEGFDPDRFLPDAEKGRPRYAYFPFGGGPRLCIGQPFAMLEAVLLVAMIVRRFDVELVPGHPVVPDVLITTRPKYGVRMHVRRAQAIA